MTTTKSRRKSVHHARNRHKRNGNSVWYFFIFRRPTTLCATQHYTRMRTQFSWDSPDNKFREWANLSFERLSLNLKKKLKKQKGVLGAKGSEFCSEVTSGVIVCTFSRKLIQWVHLQNQQLSVSVVNLVVQIQLWPCTALLRGWSYSTFTQVIAFFCLAVRYLR